MILDVYSKHDGIFHGGVYSKPVSVKKIFGLPEAVLKEREEEFWETKIGFKHL